jgi:hypothetical protein
VHRHLDSSFWRLALCSLFLMPGFPTEPLEAKPAIAPMLLSEAGCGRATAYWEQNKIITIGDRTHVVWLDSDRSGFKVRGRTLDRISWTWSPAITIGDAQDNHGGPGLTVDSQGHLHIVYFPHHGPFRYRRSLHPNDLTAWTPELIFGEGLSFPSLICGPDDTLLLTARRGFHDAEGNPIETTPVEQELWIKPADGEWRKAGILLRSRFPGYAQFATALSWGPDHRTIHLNCRIYEGNPFTSDPITTTIGYMQSPDGGKSWQRSDGSPITLPANADTIETLGGNHGADDLRLNSGPLAIDQAGLLHLSYTKETPNSSGLYLASLSPGTGWGHRKLNDYLPTAAKGWKVTLGMGGGIVFSASGRATIIAVVLNPPPEERTLQGEWGHPSTEVVRLWSDDGLQTFQSDFLSPPDTAQTHWLPNLERPTGHNQVPHEPGIIYTAGGPGAHVLDLEPNNQVWWRPGR